MRNLNFVEEGLLPLEKLMDEDLVLVTGGTEPTGTEQEDWNLLCDCDNLGCDCFC